MTRNGLLVAALAVVVLSPADADTFGTKKRTPKPSEYGNVVIDNHAARVDSDPIVFPHWLHRAKYTCRLCGAPGHRCLGGGETTRGVLRRRRTPLSADIRDGYSSPIKPSQAAHFPLP